MTYQSRIDDTGLTLGDRVYAWRSPNAAQRNPLQPDLFQDREPVVVGEVIGFMVFTKDVHIVVRVDGEADAWPYPQGVWKRGRP